jgi:hypothetical protein
MPESSLENSRAFSSPDGRMAGMFKYPFATGFAILSACSFWLWVLRDPKSAETFLWILLVGFGPFVLPLACIVGLIAWLAKRAEKNWPKDRYQ